MLNLLGVDSPYDYIGRDAFDPTYEGYALFSDCLLYTSRCV